MEKTLTRREELVHTLVLILCAVIWGSAFVAQSIGAEFVGPFTFLALRNWVAMIFLLPVILLRDRVIAMKGGISDAPANRYQWKMLVLGGMSCGTFLFLASVSQQAGISLTTTAKAGFITAQKGLRGGYTLACSPEEVTLSDVLNALDMNILADMDPKDEEGGLRPVVHDCFWEKINSNLNQYASGLTLKAFADQCKNKKSGEDWDLYVI